MRVRHVDTQIFVPSAGNREVASCGGGECCSDIGLARERALFGGAGLLGRLLDVSVPMGVMSAPMGVSA